MNSEQIAHSVDQIWDASIVPTLQRYIRIPNQSPLFDPDWKQNGHMHEAVAESIAINISDPNSGQVEQNRRSVVQARGLPRLLP